MANLTNQQIKDTYPGLLNLNVATTGVTSTPQQITDGLGNNTNVRIATNFLTAPNIFPMNGSNNYVPDYMGTGFANSAVAPTANTQNKLNAALFYDSGKYDFSAITYWVGSATTTSDVVDVAFYTTQYLNGTGVVPYQLIQSGITLNTSSAGTMQTTTLPSTLSFSAYGGGFFYYVVKITNSGVTPTIRYGASSSATATWPAFTGPILGLTIDRQGTNIGPGIGVNGFLPRYVLNTATSFQQTFTASDCGINGSVTPVNWGFALKCIK